MKKIRVILLTVFFSLLLVLPGCGSNESSSDSEVSTEIVKENQKQDDDNSTSDYTKDDAKGSSVKETDKKEESKENIQTDAPQISDASFSLSSVPAYSGSPYIAVNNNIPYFSDSDLTTQSYEKYSNLDSLGRCVVTYACIGKDIMPTEKRGDIGQIKPSGWHTVKYDCVDGKYLYNRCHLIGYQLSGENANEKNLITGTRYMNVDGMLPFENMVADYVKETNNHVVYRVTPIFEGNNLIASGVLMEAKSVEDKGDGILFCVFVYNVQPGVEIDYATGESKLVGTETPKQETPKQEPSTTVATTAEIAATTETKTTQEPVVTTTQSPAQSNPQGMSYILNTNTKKFHYPSCSSVGQMKDANKREFTGSRDEVIAQGYDPCKRCNP